MAVGDIDSSMPHVCWPPSHGWLSFGSNWTEKMASWRSCLADKRAQTRLALQLRFRPQNYSAISVITQTMILEIFHHAMTLIPLGTRLSSSSFLLSSNAPGCSPVDTAELLSSSLFPLPSSLSTGFTFFSSFELHISVSPVFHLRVFL